MKKYTAFKLIIVFQLIFIFVFGTLTIFKFPYWSPVDEGSHFSFIQHIAEEKKIPVLKKAMTGKEILSIDEKIYPKITTSEPLRIGLAGFSYEAFQPPLYYILASPFFFFSSNFIYKIFAIRFFDFLLLLLGLYLSFKLIRSVFNQKWRLPYIFTLCFFMMPGIIVRNIVISNAALEIPLALLFTINLYLFDKSKNNKYYLISSTFLGLIILTKLTLVHFIFIYIFSTIKNFFPFNTLSKIKYPFFSSLILLLLLGPWILFNLKNYHSFTANKLALEMQKPIINPTNINYTLIDTFTHTPDYFDSVLLPQEWTKHYFLNISFFNTKEISKTILFSLPLLLFIFFPKFFLKYYLFSTPLILNFIIINTMMVINDWQINLGRYLCASIIPWSAFLFLLWKKLSKKLLIPLISIVFSFNLFWWLNLYLWYYR